MPTCLQAVIIAPNFLQNQALPDTCMNRDNGDATYQHNDRVNTVPAAP